MWSPILSIIVGLLLMALPGILNYSGTAADNDHIIGPLIVTFSVISLSGCTRNIIRANLVLGGWLLLAPWILGYPEPVLYAVDMGAGIVAVICSFFQKKTDELYGGGWRSLFSKNKQNAS